MCKMYIQMSYVASYAHALYGSWMVYITNRKTTMKSTVREDK